MGAELAIVTGASSGIGAAFCRILSARGTPVLAVARRRDRLEALATEAVAKAQAAIHTMELDVTLASAATRIRARAQELGGARWLVNNAGVGAYGQVGELGDREASLVRLNCEAMV